QIVNLDLAIEDLVERLKSGKIYARDKVPSALAHFFTTQNLATLRELALREVAESLERAGEAQAVAGREAGQSAAHRRGLVCLSSYSPRANMLLRRGSRLAGRLNTDWFVVYVETPGESPTMIDAEAQRHLLANIEKARELGAEVVRLKARDPVAAIMDFARSHGVGQIIIGRSKQPWWRQIIGRSIPIRLVKEAIEFDLYIMALEDMEES